MLNPFCGFATACVATGRSNRKLVRIELSPLAARLFRDRIQTEGPLFYNLIPCTEIPRRTDVSRVQHYQTQKHSLFGLQEGGCNGCRNGFTFRKFTVDRVIPRPRVWTDHLGYLQLLGASNSRLKCSCTQEELIAAQGRTEVID